ncbi:MAG: glycosyltransferase family 2 protein [Actinomycetales bacterium]
MNLTVIVVCSSDTLIENCLASIDEDVQTIVVLNHPTPDVERIVGDFAPSTVLRHDEQNLGRLRQMAAEMAVTARVVYIDSDCVSLQGPSVR